MTVCYHCIWMYCLWLHGWIFVMHRLKINIICWEMMCTCSWENGEMGGGGGGILLCACICIIFVYVLLTVYWHLAIHHWDVIGVSKYDDPFQHFKVILLCGCVSVCLGAHKGQFCWTVCVCWFFNINKIVPILTFCVFFSMFCYREEFFCLFFNFILV